MFKQANKNIRQLHLLGHKKKTSSQIFRKHMKYSEFSRSVKDISINHLTQDMDQEH